jgi:predicted hydrolase (HD superfamily)
VRRGAEELGVDFDEHVQVVIDAMAERAGELGLEGGGSSADQGG